MIWAFKARFSKIKPVGRATVPAGIAYCLKTQPVGTVADPTFLNGSFSDGWRSPQVFDLDVPYVRLGLKPLCGIAHRKNLSFRKEKCKL
jgi:hypothetical protein